VVNKQPKNADAHNLLGFSYRKLGKFDPARKHYARALKLDPKHKGALEYLGELNLQTGDLKGAEALLTRLAAACPGGCEEREDLTKQIAAYKKKAGG
jgi:Flp pilus assembly protein TadD